MIMSPSKETIPPFVYIIENFPFYHGRYDFQHHKSVNDAW